MYKAEYTHGGGPLKNLALAMRALLNAAAFFAFWFFIGIEAETIYIIISAAVLLIMVVWNLIIPFTRRKK